MPGTHKGGSLVERLEELEASFERYCKRNDDRLSDKITSEVDRLRSELTASGVLLTPDAADEASAPCTSLTSAVFPWRAELSLLEARLVAQLSSEVESEVSKMRSELLKGRVLQEAALPKAPTLGDTSGPVLLNETEHPDVEQQLVRTNAVDDQTVEAISELVLERVRAHESIRNVEEQHEVLRQSLRDLLTRLDQSTGPSVSSRDFASLCDKFNESVALNRQVDLQLRHQRQQRNQDYTSLITRLVNVEQVLLSLDQGKIDPANSWVSGLQHTGEANEATLQFLPSQQSGQTEVPSESGSDPGTLMPLHQAVARLQELIGTDNHVAQPDQAV